MSDNNMRLAMILLGLTVYTITVVLLGHGEAHAWTFICGFLVSATMIAFLFKKEPL
jgi:hypothetical protein